MRGCCSPGAHACMRRLGNGAREGGGGAAQPGARLASRGKRARLRRARSTVESGRQRWRQRWLLLSCLTVWWCSGRRAAICWCKYLLSRSAEASHSGMHLTEACIARACGMDGRA